MEWTSRPATRQEYGRWLIQGLVKLMEANAGAIWVSSRGLLFRHHVAALEHVGIDPGTLAHRGHLRLLKRVWRDGQPFDAPSRWDGGLRGGANPTDSRLLVAAVKQAGQTVALIEIFHRPDVPMVAPYLRFLEQVGEIASRSLAMGSRPT